MNLFIYFVDSVTWPENLRFYLSADAEFNADALDVINTCEYPFTSIDNRLKVGDMRFNIVCVKDSRREKTASNLAKLLCMKIESLM